MVTSEISFAKTALNREFDSLLNEFDILLQKTRMKYPGLSECQIFDLAGKIYQSYILKTEQDIYVRNL